jgi:hypothetical protein
MLKAKYAINSTIELSNTGLLDTWKKYYDEPTDREAKSIVAGLTFLKYLNKWLLE